MDILAKERKLRELESKIEELDNESLIAKLKELDVQINNH